MTQEAPAGRGAATPRATPPWPSAWPVLLFLGFALIDLVVLRGALHGPFVSDDQGYIVSNPYIRELSMENLAAIFDPGSPAQIHAVGNYSPLHMLLHALEWQIFADRVVGYHLVNVLLHALCGVLLVALLLSSKLPPTAALLGGALFSVHPANVEAVAWISQLKTTAGLALGLGALLTLPRHAGLATLLFAGALLTKAHVAFVLPGAVAFSWVRRGGAREAAWLGVWLLLLAGFAWVELAEFARFGLVEQPAYADRFVHLRSIAALGSRYLAMASTGFGLSAYHEPEPVRSLLDPWWLAALPCGALLAWRSVVTLRRREEEAAWWVLAGAAFVPVSQLVPFVHPMADHYLYFILPGLIGGTLLWGSRLRGRFTPAVWRAGLVAALALGVLFAWQASQRARLWRSGLLLSLDAAKHYPDGRSAQLLRARSAAQAGDAEAALAALRAAGERGLYEFRQLQLDPGLAPIRQLPAFQELVREWAGIWIERARQREPLSRSELRIVGLAHLQRGELDAAVAAYERALAVAGPDEQETRRELEAARALRAREAAGAG